MTRMLGPKHALHRQVEGAFDALAEPSDLVALAGERLHHAHPGDGFDAETLRMGPFLFFGAWRSAAPD